MKKVFQHLRLSCPHCQKTKTVRCSSLIPLQRFDMKCCMPWAVDVEPLKESDNGSIIWKITWQ